MDSVVFDGVEYVKAAVAAKKFKYTSDYVGQLCRAKKIDARLVGRTWFVNLDSLTTHKKNKHNKSDKKDDKKTDDTAEVAITRIHSADTPTKKTPVVPVIKSKTFKAFAYKAAELPATGERTLHVSYDRDDESLMPVIERKHTRPAKTIRIENADAQKLRIKGGSKQTSYTADEIPEFALSGKVKVHPLEEAESAEEETNEKKKENKANNKDISDKLDTSKAVEPKAEPKRFVKVQLKKDDDMKPTKKPVEKKVVAMKVSETEVRKAQEAQPASVPASFTPKSVSQTNKNRKVRLKPVPASALVMASPLFATIAASLLVAGIFATSSDTLVSEQFYTSNIVLSIENVLLMFAR